MSFGDKIVKNRKLILIISIILLIPATLGYVGTRTNYDMLSYLPKSMESVKGQNILMKEFGKGGFSIVVTENLSKNRVSTLAKEYKKIPHVETVMNLNDVLDPNVPKEMYPDEVKENLCNKNASMLVVFFDTSISDDHSMEAIQQIRKVSGKECFASGMTACVEDLKNLCQAEEAKYVAIAVVLSLIAMMMLLDSYIAPVIFLASIGMAIVYNMGSNILLGEVSFITKAIAAVLQLGVTMDYSIFLWHSYMEKQDEGMEHHKAMGEAINATLISVTGSSVTTIAGFLALCFMTYTMGKDLGIVMAKGVVFGVIASVTILPALLLTFDGILQKTRHRTLIPDVSKLSHALTSHYAIYIIIMVLLVVPIIYGYQHNNIVYDFSKMLGEDLTEEQAPFLKASEKLSEDFEINTTHMIIADKDISQADGKAMSHELRKIDGVKTVLGVDSMLSPEVPKEILPQTVSGAVISKNHQLILVNSKYKVSSDECNAQIDKIDKVVHKYDSKAKVIGEGPAIKDLVALTSKDFKVVNFISIAAVFIILLIVLKSWSLPFILVAAIEFAVYLNLSIPGFTGTELAFIIPVCISTIQLGSTVDYAILESTRYKSERIAGRGKREAIEIASRTSMPSILVSAMGFFTATFGVAIYSNIGIISVMCGLMARGAIISMATVVLILPSLLMVFDKFIIRSTKGMKGIRQKEEIKAAL